MPEQIPKPLSAEAVKLLEVAEDKDLDGKVRANAVRDLRRLKEEDVVPRLLKLLPGEYDLLTFEILGVIRQFGDPRAIPALEKMVTVHHDELAQL